MSASPSTSSSSSKSSSNATSLDPKSQSALIKLIFFTLCMVIAPISTYFVTLKHIWGAQNTTYAAVSAAITANLVVFAYIVTALREDMSSDNTSKPTLIEKKKD